MVDGKTRAKQVKNKTKTKQNKGRPQQIDNRDLDKPLNQSKHTTVASYIMWECCGRLAMSGVGRASYGLAPASPDLPAGGPTLHLRHMNMELLPGASLAE